ncbi:C39 family peptidase [Nocardia sp. NPDC059240]|uniref:C39 family peptidase n=1 Tax=Nocardia sp. NPDC059240 TaxID=3346786 RepID=UPI0036A0FE2A
MAEHVLAHQYSPQETGYWCGPASTQIVLTICGIDVPEQQLAAEIGTDTDGTDWIGQITEVLARRSGRPYVTREIPNDPPTPGQREQLWADIRASIDSGNGLIANIVAPPGNQPPGYPPGQTIYHYIALVGYRDGGDVYVADPARFGGYEHYWLSLDQLASLIAPKGYAAVPAGAPVPPPSAAVTFGVDISNHQAGLDLDRVFAEGFEFVIAKCTEGEYYRDPTWPGFRDATLGAGKVLAGYHYVRADGDAEAQAAAFVEHLGDPSIPAMLDHEDGSGDLGAFLAVREAIERRGVRVALSYLPQWYWDRIGRPDLSGIPPLMTSHYGPRRAGFAAAIYPGHDDIGWQAYGGGDPRIFQFSDRGLVAGREIDVDAFRGTPSELRDLLTGDDDMAFTDDDRRMLREIWEQLRGPNAEGWPQLGTNAEGKNMTPVDALAEIRATVKGK